MKNQGVWVTRIIVLALCAFVVAYMGYHVVSALSVPFRTVTAVLYKTEETAAFSGLVIRDEAAIELPTGLMEFRVAVGEKVKKGQVIAVSYADSSTMQVNEEIRSLESRLEQLAYIEAHSPTSSDPATIERDIQQGITGIMARAGAGDISGMHGDALALKSALFRREYTYGDAGTLAPMIESLEAELEALKGRVSNVAQQLTAQQPGVFSPTTDGLEAQLGSGMLDSLTHESLNSFLAADRLSVSYGKGKLVTDFTWHLVMELDEDIASLLGKSAEMRFDDGTVRNMSVRSVSKPEDGRCIAVFSCAEGISEIVDQRSMSGEIILSRYQGIRVPKEAIRVDEDGSTYVYCVVLSQLKKKTVEIMPDVDRENYFLVKAEAAVQDTDNLLQGDELVVAGKELYNGKVVR